jgi:hypothetical protein
MSDNRIEDYWGSPPICKRFDLLGRQGFVMELCRIGLLFSKLKAFSKRDDDNRTLSVGLNQVSEEVF